MVEIVTVDDGNDSVDGPDGVGSADHEQFGCDLIFVPSKVDVDGQDGSGEAMSRPIRGRKHYKFTSFRHRVRTDSTTTDSADPADCDDADARSVRSGYSGYSGYSNDDELDDDDCGSEREDVVGSVPSFPSPKLRSFCNYPHSLKLRKSQSEFLRGLPDEDEHSEEATPIAAVRRSLSLPELELRRDSGAVDHGKLYQNRWGSSIPLHEGGLMEGAEELSGHRFFYEAKGIQIKRWRRDRKRESFRERIKEDTAASMELEDDVINQMVTDSEMECSAVESVGITL